VGYSSLGTQVPKHTFILSFTGFPSILRSERQTFQAKISFPESDRLNQRSIQAQQQRDRTSDKSENDRKSNSSWFENFHVLEKDKKARAHT